MYTPNVVLMFAFLFFTIVFAFIVAAYFYYLKPRHKSDVAITCDVTVDDNYPTKNIPNQKDTQPNISITKYNDPFGFSLEKHNVHQALLSHANVYDFFKIM
jgi:hypothetical protein